MAESSVALPPYFKEVVMHFFPADQHPPHRPACSACSTQMWLLTSKPHAVRDAYDMRTFECPVCKTISQIVVDRWTGKPSPGIQANLPDRERSVGPAELLA